MNRTVGSLVCLILSGLTLTVSIAAQTAIAADAKTFSLDSWVCNSPETYDLVTKAESAGDTSTEALQESYIKTCLYMDDDNIEDMLPPFVTLIKTEGNKSQVSFFVEFYKKVRFLHRKIKQVRFVGWTASSNVKPFLR